MLDAVVFGAFLEEVGHLLFDHQAMALAVTGTMGIIQGVVNHARADVTPTLPCL
jgi:hypothetical protein